MSEKEYGTFGPAVDTETFFRNPVFYEHGIDTVPSKEYSLYVSELMDRLGYNYEMIKYRQQMYPEVNKLQLANRHRHLAYTRIKVGGQGEGTALHYENDHDHMIIIKDVICADNPQHFSHEENVTIFQSERQETSPGYTRLKLVRFDGKLYEEEIYQSLFKNETDSYFLSSQFFINTLRKGRTVQMLRAGMTPEPISGPSLPSSDKFISLDQVYCFRCFCPDIVERWVSRPRARGWPSEETVCKISLLDGHVVPVGFKGSQNMYREWRICYSLAELHLMQSLNETQLKVYILLKKICKSVLSTVCNHITSYIMKNIILWVSEINGIARFTQEFIMDRLFDCIQYLKKSVCENNLPSYMIPERNLLAGKLEIQQKLQLSSLLSDLLLERGRMLLRCDKLRDGMIVMYKTRNRLREYGEKRDEVERLLLVTQRIKAETLRPGMSTKELDQRVLQNEMYITIMTRISHLVEFDSQTLRQMGKSQDEIDELLNTKICKLLS